MILDDLAIVAAHEPLMVNGSLGDAYSWATAGCCVLVDKLARSRGQHVNGRAEIAVVLDLGVRMVNSCGAAGRLILSGYWSPAAHQSRDLVECYQLIEFFRLYPAKAEEWATATGKDRMREFRFGRIQKILQQNPDAKDVADVKFAFDFYSNIGSHPSMEGLSFHMANGMKFVGPTPDGKRFLLFAADLWAYMTRATLRFIDTVETLMPNLPRIADEFRYDTAVVLGGRDFLAPISADDIDRLFARDLTTALAI
jgi:hypothetical protein